MPPKNYRNALSMRAKIDEVGNSFHKDTGYESERADMFRFRMSDKFFPAFSLDEFENSLPIKFRTYIVRDADRQRERSALSNFLLSQRIEASTQNLGRQVPDMPAGISEISNAVRYFLTKTGRKDLADEFERTMEVDPSLEATDEQKKTKAYARGRMLAKLSEEFRNETPENIETPASFIDFKRLNPRFIFLQALSSYFSKSLDTLSKSGNVSFTDEDLKLCRHVSEFDAVSERVLKQSDFICSPCYKYFNVDSLLHNMEYKEIHDLCKNAERIKEPMKTFVNDIDAAAYYIPYENANQRASDIVKDINKNNDTLPDRLFKQVKAADPFYIVNGSDEYDEMKKSMNEYSSLKVSLNPEDKNFEKNVEKLTKLTNKLLKKSNGYLTHKGNSAVKNREIRRVEAAKAVSDFAKKQLESLKELKYFKSIAGLDKENKNTNINSAVNSEKEPSSSVSSLEFYRRGKSFAGLKYQVTNDNTDTIQNGLNNVFNPTGEEENWFAALNLGNARDFKKPYIGTEKRMAEDLITHMVAKEIISKVQKNVYPSGNKDKPKTPKTPADRLFGKINVLAEGLSYDEFAQFIKLTNPLKNAFSKITPENVYKFVTDENWSSLDSLSKDVMKNIPTLVAKNSGSKQRKSVNVNSNKMEENISKSKTF